MSTFPAEIVRLGSIYIFVGLQRAHERLAGTTNHDGNEGVLVLLVRHLGRHVDAREPAPIPRMRVVPADRVLKTPNLTRKRYQLAPLDRPTNHKRDKPVHSSQYTGPCTRSPRWQH